jgi:hypothetical protein
MNIKMLTPILLSLLYGQALAADGKIIISAPANGATLSAKNKITVTYDAVLGAEGDHLHLYVDDKRIDVLRQIKGSTEMDALLPGKHHICLTVNTKSHAATGVESCVDVTSQ